MIIIFNNIIILIDSLVKSSMSMILNCSRVKVAEDARRESKKKMIVAIFDDWLRLF